MVRRRVIIIRVVVPVASSCSSSSFPSRRRVRRAPRVFVPVLRVFVASCLRGHTASDSDVKLKSRMRSAGIWRPAATASGRPMSSSRFSISSGLSFQRKFFSGARDLALLDQERAVAGQAGVEHGPRLERADVEEVGDEDAALAAGNQLLGALRSAGQLQPAAEHVRRAVVGCRPSAAPCFCAQKRVYDRFLSTPFSIQTLRSNRQPLDVERHRRADPDPRDRSRA